MGMSTRVLGLNDEEEMFKIVTAQTTHFGIPTDPESVRARAESMKAMLDPQQNDRSLLIGHFDQNQKLQAVIGLLFWRALPYATFHHLIATPGRKLFFQPESAFGSCYQYALKLGIEREVTKFFAICRKDHFLVWERLRKRYGRMDNRFDRRIEANIPANTLPRFSTWREFLNGRPFPFETVIFSDFLKQELESYDRTKT